MSTRHAFSTIARLALGAAVAITSAACGGEMLRTGRAPVFLVVGNMTATSGATSDTGSVLHSDVETFVEVTVAGVVTKVPTYYDDTGLATLRVEAKNQSVTTTVLNSVTLTRYHVNYRRADGRNTPGVDVPYGFDGGVGVTVDAGRSADVGFQLVRHQGKLEPPLRNMRGFGGLSYLSVIAEVTFYGHDQNGNEVTVTGNVDVQFADFGDDL